MRDQVVWNAFELSDGGTVVFARRIDDEYILQVFPQLGLQLFLLWQHTREVKFVASLIHSQQFPDVEQEIDCIKGTLNGVAVLEFETVLLECKYIQLFVMEITE